MNFLWYVSTALSVLGLSIGALLFFLLLTLKNERSYGNRILSLFVFTLCLALTLSLTKKFEYAHAYYLLMCFASPLLFLLGPTLYFYARWMCLGEKIGSSFVDYAHFVPLLLALINFSPFYFEYLAQAGLPSQEVTPLITQRSMFQTLYIILASYCICCYLLIQRYQTRIKEHYADVETINLFWLMRLSVGMGMLLFIDTSLGIWISYAHPGWLDIHNAMITAVVFYLLYLSYYSLRQPLILHGENVTNQINAKYEKSSLEESRATYFEKKLRTLMEDEQAYLDNELTLTRLANTINISPHHLSQILNTKLNTRFYDYINDLRIEHAKQLLTNTQKSVLDVCYDSGFNNKVSFNSAFKKRTELTPSEWRTKAA